MPYLNWDTKVLSNPSTAEIERMYDAGYVFTRVDKGVMNKTRSFRVNMKAYAPSSENRRILRKGESMTLSVEPIPYLAYDWSIGKLAKDFYEKLGAEFSANKVKELFTDADASNFNTVLVFTDTATKTPVGFVICYRSNNILHYSYPFYLEDPSEPSRGLAMMTKAIEWAKTQGLIYVYLGSLQRPSDTYKLQFLGGEWFDGETWQFDTKPLKEILSA
ncbi:MAG TPA: GNAT family N-acetyltransferase [Candidatus Paceibacterota bacterium]|jgi:Putative arginyl-tRNA:protein arginylyltransferase